MNAITRRAALRGAAAVAAIGAVPIAAMDNIVEFVPRTLELAEERHILECQIADRMRGMYPLTERIVEITRTLGDGGQRREKFMTEWRAGGIPS